MTNRAESRLRQVHREVTRSRVVGAAYALFVERGFNGPSMEEIAERAGVNRGTIYLHFKSKADILTDLVLATYEITEPLFDQLSHIGSRQQGIKVAYEFITHWEGKLGKTLSVLSGAVGSDPSVDELMRNYRKYTLLMGQAMLEGYGVPPLMARARSSLIFGLAMEQMNRLTAGQTLGISRKAMAEAFADIWIAATRPDCGADSS